MYLSKGDLLDWLTGYDSCSPKVASHLERQRIQYLSAGLDDSPVPVRHRGHGELLESRCSLIYFGLPRKLVIISEMGCYSNRKDGRRQEAKALSTMPYCRLKFLISNNFNMGSLEIVLWGKSHLPCWTFISSQESASAAQSTLTHSTNRPSVQISRVG